MDQAKEPAAVWSGEPYTTEARGLPRATIATVIIFIVLSAVLGLIIGRDLPELHMIVDTAMFVLSAILALLLWDMGSRLNRPFKKHLSITFAIVSSLEFLHTMTSLEWSGPLAAIQDVSRDLRPLTWPPSAYLLPTGVGLALWLLHRRIRETALFLIALASLACLLFALFQNIPPYSAQGVLGVTRPSLIGVPVLWSAITWMSWRLRAKDRAIASLGLMSATILVSSIVMLYSQYPPDANAIIAHLGRIAGYLALLFTLMHFASFDMIERMRAETALRRANEDLDARVKEQTALLWTSNEQLAAEIAERRKSHELLLAVTENTPAVIYIKDLEGRYLMVNPRFCEIFGLKSAAIIGNTDHAIFPKDAADAFRAMDERVLKAEHALTEEETAPHQDGLHNYISVKAPLRGDDGRPYAMFGISTDITDLKKAEARLQAQFERMALLDQITRAIGERQDLDSIFQVTVRSIEDQLPADFVCLCLYDRTAGTLVVARIGLKSETLAISLAMTEQGRIEIDQNGLSRCVAGHLVYEPDIVASAFPFPQRLARGGLRSFVAAPLQVESQVFGVLIVARKQSEGFVSGECEFLRQLSEHVALAANQAQLTSALQHAYDDLRQTQEAVMQQERLRALGQMASGIAHDINNALSPVAIYTESLLETEDGLSPRAKSQLEIVQRAISDAAQTIARMREFYRQREAALALAPVPIKALLQQVIDLTKSRWKDMPQQRGAEIDMRLQLQEALSPVLGVESELREALVNLVFNAVDALPQGGVLTLAAQKAEEKDFIQIEVADNGMGMDEQTRRRCLEPFFTTKGEAGTGLGLAMVYGVAQRHGGDLDIESAPGMGTRIRLTLPAAEQTNAAVAAANIPARPTERLRLLLIDDDPILLRSLRDVLENDGHVVSTAAEGGVGVAAFNEAIGNNRFDVVITDLGMPKMDGRRVAAAIKETSPQTPILLLTGWGERLIAEGAPIPHVDRVLSKPPKLRELRATLAELHLPKAQAPPL